MVTEDVRKIMSLSAQADRLTDLRVLKRISEDQYTIRVADLRRQCSFKYVDLENAAWGS
jgi:hypothetical protein